MAHTFSIAPRFSGPPNMANGGYAAGLIARNIGKPVAIRLHKPVPLETPLELVNSERGWEARAGDTCVASARQVDLSLEIPSAVPSYEESCGHASEHPANTNLRYYGCFVCGTARGPGDGLRIFSGHVPGRELVVAPFRPDRSLLDEQGELHDEIVWAALDCPGYFASFQDGKYALLGELTAKIERPLEVDACYVVAGWPLGIEGRKRQAGTALFDHRGTLVAAARATWIEVASA